MTSLAGKYIFVKRNMVLCATKNKQLFDDRALGEHEQLDAIPFAKPKKGKGIQDLKKIGDKIILEHSFTEGPIPGELTDKWFVCKSDEDSTEFNGFSVVGDVSCAILEIDCVCVGGVLFHH